MQPGSSRRRFHSLSGSSERRAEDDERRRLLNLSSPDATPSSSPPLPRHRLSHHSQQQQPRARRPSGAESHYGACGETMTAKAMGNETTVAKDAAAEFPAHIGLAEARRQRADSMGMVNADSESHLRLNTGDRFHAIIELDDDEKLNVWARRTTLCRTIFVWLLSIVTLGAARLVLYWYPKWFVALASAASTMDECDHLLVIDDHQNVAFRPVRLSRPASADDHLCLPFRAQHVAVAGIRFFTYRKLTYVWDPLEGRFGTVAQMEGDPPVTSLRNHWLRAKGLASAEVDKLLALYGRNVIEVKLKPILVLLFKEAISPFYIFQIFSVAVWYTDNYEYYASIIVLMSVTSITMDVYQIRRQERKLRSMVHSEEVVEVIRDGGECQRISSSMLVPGDILIIPPRGCILQCDCVLMNGTVILNESMLTGESVPVTKVALPPVDHGAEPEFSIRDHSKHVMYCGTSVLQTRYYSGKPVQAIVLRTAYSTLKGQLVRSIMYPKPVDFRFTKDLFRFVGFLAAIAALGFLYTIVVMITRGSSTKKIIVRSLDIVTIVVPPALPAAMSIGIFAAQMRLRAKQIFCISPSTINTCGALNVVCFDKTGTLTEDGLDFHCLRAVHGKNDESESDESDDDSDSRNSKRSDDAAPPAFGDELRDFTVGELPHSGELLKAMSSCHSLTRIDGELRGDPLDLILFNKTGWLIDESAPEAQVEETELFDQLQPTVVRSPPSAPTDGGGDSDVELAVIRQFTFSSSLQRMAVIVHNPNESGRRMHLYVKGSPEIVASLCHPTTVPADYEAVVNSYAQHGYRLIAVASRTLRMNYMRAQKVKRDAIECDLRMLGLIVMENRLKEQTNPVIAQLNRAHIRAVMITGDNLLTAMSVARECGILRPHKRTLMLEHGGLQADERVHLTLRQSAPPTNAAADEENSTEGGDQSVESGLNSPNYQLAVSGPTFAAICEDYPELVDKLICVCDVYARMSPEQKQLLVNRLQDIDYTVAMCGDGANDCAALKAAHAGISLSEAEASIAAPFTSKVPDIRCVPTVIREGRGALVTSFGVFKYMAGYSLTQFITIMQLYWLNTNLTDLQFLYIDLGLITLVALFFGYTPACEKLFKVPPPTRLLSLGSALSIVGQLFIIASFQLFTFLYTATQPWFIPYAPPLDEEAEDRRSMQGTALFCVSTFQYLTLAIIYSKGYPYRKPFYTNKPFCISIVSLTLLSAWITLQPPPFLIRWLEFDPIPYFEDRLFLLFVALLSGTASYLFERYVIEQMIMGVRERRKKRKQVIANSHDAPRFELILNIIGAEPYWIRSQTMAGLRSEPAFPLSDHTHTSPSLRSDGFAIQPLSPTNGPLAKNRRLSRNSADPPMDAHERDDDDDDEHSVGSQPLILSVPDVEAAALSSAPTSTTTISGDRPPSPQSSGAASPTAGFYQRDSQSTTPQQPGDRP